jgi:hypothetical protein
MNDVCKKRNVFAGVNINVGTGTVHKHTVLLGFSNYVSPDLVVATLFL